MSASLSRDQKVLAVEAIFKGAVRRIEAAPTLTEFSLELSDGLKVILDTVRSQLIELAKALGRDVTELDQCTQFRRMTEIYVNEKRIGVAKNFKEVRGLAELLVDQYFTE